MTGVEHGVQFERLPIGPKRDRSTHYLFRYPAKFHPPVAATLLDSFVKPDDTVLDPFCGSGTLLVEAAATGRRGIGLDVDPVAAEVSLAKTRQYDLDAVASFMGELKERLTLSRRDKGEYDRLQFTDITPTEFDRTIATDGLWVPAIPNIHHWFRRYVTVDLAHIWMAIAATSGDDQARLLARVAFASIIRNASNADPVPVSGLEVTAHMRRREEAGRVINPHDLIARAIERAERAVAAFAATATAEQVVLQGDALNLHGLIQPESVDAVITSPPYNNAVDYYRRHQLEMFWLGHVSTQQDRLTLLPKYIGKHRVAARHPLLKTPWEPGPYVQELEANMREESAQRANDLRAYYTAMRKWFDVLRPVVKDGAPVVLVLGQSSWGDKAIETDTLVREAAGERYALEAQLWYPVTNRYMSYTRRNSASISREIVLVFRAG